MPPFEGVIMQEIILRFNNSRTAKYFADKFGYEYLGWVEEKTSIKIARASGSIETSLDGCYMCREFREIENG